jgi:hypothetical protein
MGSTTRELATTAVAVHAPELLGAEIVELGHGLDHAAYAVGGLVLRVANGHSVAREARLLEALSDHVPSSNCSVRPGLGHRHNGSSHVNAERSLAWLFP